MNINDFKSDAGITVPIDKLEAIFNRQKELMEKYHDIEMSSGLMQTGDCPVDLHSKQGQARMKDFSWRITEELMEALEAYKLGDKEHFNEELIDALHFMVEQHVLAGIEPGDYIHYITPISGYEDLITKDGLDFYFNAVVGIRSIKGYTFSDDMGITKGLLDIIESIGLAMNCLKNKPWKQTHMLTDVQKFKLLMSQAFLDYIRLMKFIGITPIGVYDLYFRKSKVNAFRQESKY